MRPIICTSLTRLVGAEMLMNTTFEPSGNELRLTGLVTLLALVSAISMAGCQLHAVAQTASSSAPVEAAQVVASLPNPLEGMEPIQPFDEKLVTTMETVGASDKD